MFETRTRSLLGRWKVSAGCSTRLLLGLLFALNSSVTVLAADAMEIGVGYLRRATVKPTLSLYAPFYLSSRGYAVFVRGDWPGRLAAVGSAGRDMDVDV